MRECASDLPTAPLIEPDRQNVRLNDTKIKSFITAGDYFSFCLREQTLSYSISTVFAKHP